MDTPENQIPLEQVLQDPPAPAATMQSRRMRFIIFVIILSLVFGAIGGAGGALWFLRTPSGQKVLGMQSGSAVSQNVSLTENSAIINVVKKDSPAVVSIVVSQDLNQIPGYGMNSGGQNPFDFFFSSGGDGSGGSSGNNTPQPQSTQPDVQEVAAGSGFFVSADGLILTNKHVVSQSDASYTVITSDGKTYDAKVVAQDPVEDLALVKISIQNAPYLTFSNSSDIQIGQAVVAIGNSLGEYQNTVTSGIISGIGRSITAGGEDGSEDLSGVIQTDAAINPGNSGGPLLDMEGNVVGINTAIDQQGQLVGFAIPSNNAGKDVSSYQKSGNIVHSFLGVRYIDITAAIAQQQNLPETYGALLVRGDTTMDFAVQPGSPADKAGLEENDIILSVNGTKLDSNNTLSAILMNFNPGDTVSMQVYHKGKTETINVTLGSTPSS